MDTSKTPYGPGMPIKQTPNIIGGERAKNGGKPKARYPHKPQGNQPAGGGSTSGSFKRALTPGTSPTGS
ncbi:MAG: hypothetical protein KF863_21430 [Rubrivivax sp.]|nr:hypothetical protein [Rubrivivax sp.]